MLAGSQADFGLLIVVDGSGFYRDLGAITIPSADNSNIPFGPVDLTAVSWSGTIDLRVNGSFPSGSVNIQACDANTGGPLGSGQVNTNGSWSITLNEPYSGTKQVSFRVYFSNSGRSAGERTLPATAQTGSDLGTYSFITLEGSVAVSLNGTPITSGSGYDISVYARTVTEYSGYRDLGYANVDPHGQWSMMIESLSASTNVYFSVNVYDQINDNWIGEKTGGSESVFNSPITIALGTVDFNIITLSGTVSGAVDGVSPDGYMIAAIASDENTEIGNTVAAPSGDWSIELEALGSSKTVSFVVGSLVGESLIFTRLPPSYSRPVYNTDGPGSALTGSELSFTAKTIQVDITSDGSTPAPGQVFICNSQVVQADMSSNDAMWLKVITMPEVQGIASPVQPDGGDNGPAPGGGGGDGGGDDGPAPGGDGGGDNGPAPGGGNDGGGSASIRSSWTLKVPSATSEVFFFVMTASGYYASTAPASSNTTLVTLNLSTMTQF
jgi:hypothetical protein